MSEDETLKYKMEMFDDLIYELRHLTYRLRLISMMIVMVLILSICSLVAATVSGYFLYPFRIIGLFVSLSGVVLLYYFDLIRKRGMVFYDTMSDEIESYHMGLEPDLSLDKMIKGMRMSMRRFLQFTDLPIVPGNVGQGLYMTIFVLLAIVNALFTFFG